MSIEVVQRNAFTGMAAAVEAAWRRHAERLDGAFLATFQRHNGAPAAPKANRVPGESETVRAARLDARERRVRAEMRKRNEFIPRDDSPTGQINAWNPFLPEGDSPAARVNAKANPFLPKDTDIDGRNPFLPK